MINPNIHVQKCEQLDAAIVEIAALKQQLQSAREELQTARGMLEVARCPNCDGSGTTRCGDQCEFCFRRNEMLNPETPS